MNRSYLGIDPGKHGGLSLITADRKVFAHPIPLIGKSGKEEIDERELAKFMQTIYNSYPNTLVIIEDVHSIFGTSAKSNFNFGYTAGMLKGMAVAIGFAYTMVQPKMWQKEVWINSDKVYDTKSTSARLKTDTKSTALKAVNRLYPNIDFNFSKTGRGKKQHDGCVDATLLAHYGLIKNL